MKNSAEYSLTFFLGMKNRMLTSYYKYGSSAQNAPSLKTMVEVRKRWALYQKTGNTEWLMDAANFLMIEFMYPKHKKAHFRATSSSESPGVSHLTAKEIDDLNRKNRF